MENERNIFICPAQGNGINSSIVYIWSVLAAEIVVKHDPEWFAVVAAAELAVGR